MLQQLEYLLALARERHFGRAAAACHVTQPALSTAIRRLEQELGVVIVHRSRRFEGFTDEGARIVTWAHRILAEQREMLADVGRMQGQLTATARIGAIPTSVAAVPFLTAEFRRANPAAACQVLALPSREIARLLTEFELDAGLTYLDDETPPGTRRVELYRERYLLLAPADHALMSSSEVPWTQAARLPLCALTSDMRNRRILDAQMALHGVTIRPTIEANTVGALYVHLSAGEDLAAIVAHPWVHAFGIPQGMAARPMESKNPGPAVGLITLDRTRTSIITEALLAAARRAEVATRLETSLRAAMPSTGSDVGSNGPERLGVPEIGG